MYSVHTLTCGITLIKFHTVVFLFELGYKWGQMRRNFNKMLYNREVKK